MRRGSGMKKVRFYAAPILFSREKRMGRKTRRGKPLDPAEAAHHQMRIGCTGIRKACVAGKYPYDVFRKNKIEDTLGPYKR